MPPDQRYSFVFDGTAQSLDHAITSQALDALVRGVEHARGNADAPFAFANDGTTALRSSDHDGTVLFLTVDSDADGVPDNLDACAETKIPEGVPTRELNPNHYALVDGTGCSIPPRRGTQLVDAVVQHCRHQGLLMRAVLDRRGKLEAGERSFGCSPGTMKNWTEGQVRSG